MTTTNPEQNRAEAQFMVQRIYTKNVSFETTNSPAVFQQQWEPELTLDLNTAHTLLDKGTYEVVLTVTATVKNKGLCLYEHSIKITNNWTKLQTNTLNK